MTSARSHSGRKGPACLLEAVHDSKCTAGVPPASGPRGQLQDEGGRDARGTLWAAQIRSGTLLAALACWFLAAQVARAENVAATVPVGTNPRAVAVNPVTNKIYIANYG
ncbi:MAG: hypothetical protein ABSE73_10535, partial [Planctomycetota bacterium]